MAKSKQREEDTARDAESTADSDAEQLAEQAEQLEDDIAETAVSDDHELSELRSKLAEAEDRVLRARAEVENIQRRAARDVENAHKFGVERLVRDLVPVIDSLEKAVEVAQSEAEDTSDAQGIELATKLLLDTLSRHGVERIVPEGEPFDPVWHEAVATAANDDCEENSVLNIVQAGFSLNGRLVRAAKVVVSRASTA